MKKIKELLRKFLQPLGNALFSGVKEEIVTTRTLLIDKYIRRNLFENPKYADTKKLTKYEYQVYSQNGEDGIIAEIFSRIGTTDKFFVEFGVSNGLECNSLFLLLKNWKGCWLDGGKENVRMINKKFFSLIRDAKLSIKQAFITAENIETLFAALGVPREFDLLSIDIDGNDYYVWNAIKNYSPRVVIIEYNALFRPPVEFCVKYDAGKSYSISSHFGASLKTLEILGAKKGYKLVGCNFSGVNAFFVREDLAKDKFLAPFTAETHYEDPKYFLLRTAGHKRDFGEFAVF